MGFGDAPMDIAEPPIAFGERPTGRPGAVTLDWEGRVFPGNAGVLAGFGLGGFRGNGGAVLRL